MLELLEDCFTDEVYVAVLSDWLEDQDHPLAGAVKLMRDKVIFIVEDERDTCPSVQKYDLFSPLELKFGTSGAVVIASTKQTQNIA